MGGRVLVGCELSGVVRRAFRAVGVEAWSCDLEPAEDGAEHHLQMDVRLAVTEHGPWALGIFHPPCTYLAASSRGYMHLPWRQREAVKALDLVRWLLAYQRVIPRVCVENPIGIISTRVAEPAQIIQPWQFGHGETKATCLWLRNLPELRYTDKVAGREQRLARLGQSKGRARIRSRTFEGVGAAMAAQWGPMVA